MICFTATQIPDITDRKYPAELAGELYPDGIPIYEEKDMEKLIKENNIDEVFFSYSDVPHEYVMHLGSRVLAAGASYSLLGPKDTTLKSSKKILSVCAVRTGAGKSPVSRRIGKILKEKGVKFVVVRHPMPYGDLKKQEVQRFETLDDLDKANCTVEEREDYEHHIKNGTVVFAGVDYEKILRAAEKEADIVIWDGGNNDLPFYKPDLHIVIADALRPHHELLYHPGEANFRMADLIVINKVDGSEKGEKIIRAHAENSNPMAKIMTGNLELRTEDKMEIKGKKALVVEDGPTTTHGGMAFGAAYEYAKKQGADIIDPKKSAMGSMKKVFEKFGHISEVLPAMGYYGKQLKELEESINSSDAEIVVSGTPTDLRNIINVKKPVVQVTYGFIEKEGNLEKIIEEFLS